MAPTGSPGRGPAPGESACGRRAPAVARQPNCKAWDLSGAKAAVGKTTVIAGGGYRDTGLVLHPRTRPLAARKEDLIASHRKVSANVEHTFARMKTWKILRHCRLTGDGVHHAMLGIARLHPMSNTARRPRRHRTPPPIPRDEARRVTDSWPTTPRPGRPVRGQHADLAGFRLAGLP